MQRKELRTDQVLCSDVSSESRVREGEAGVAGKGYSLERKVSSTKIVCEWRAKREQLERKRKMLMRREHNTSKRKERLDARAIPQRGNAYCIG
jgi:hypothetical protein